MATVENISAQMSDPNSLPLEEQGMWKYEPKDPEGPIQFLRIPQLTQSQVDDVKLAYDSHQFLLTGGKARDGVSVRVFVNSYIPSPQEFIDNHEASMNGLVRSYRNIEYIKSKTTKKVARDHLLTMELIRRITTSLEQFDDGTRNPPSFLTR